MYKSVKLTWLDSGVCLSKYIKDPCSNSCQNTRFVRAWCDYNQEDEVVYHLQAGFNDLGVDYREEHDSLDSLRESMGDLRHWIVDDGW